MAPSSPQPHSQSHFESQSQTTHLPLQDGLSPSLAHHILDTFTIDSSEDRELFASLLTSGLAPPAEVCKLWELSLMRGMEEWEMMMDCAIALRNQTMQSLRLQQRKGQNEGQKARLGTGMETSGNELCLLPFLDLVMNGLAPCAVLGSVLGKRDKYDGMEESSPLAKGRRGGSKRMRKMKKAAVGRGVSRFWADDDGDDDGDTPKMSTPKQKTSLSGHAGKAVKHEEQGQEGVDAVLQGGEMTVVHRPAGISQGNGASEEKQSSLREDADLMGSEVPDGSGFLDTQIPGYSHAPSSPSNESVDADLDDGSMVDVLSVAPLPAAHTRKPYKSPFFSAPSLSPKKPMSKITTSPSKPKFPSKKPQTPRPPGISSLPIPPLSAPSFGLIQEELASDPFRLLIAVTFLIKVRGSVSIPLFRQLMNRFPTPEALAAADPAEIINLIRPLGLSANRCSVIQRYARMWIECPPCKEKRYGVRNYPGPSDARGVKVGEEFGAEPDDFYCNYTGKGSLPGIGGTKDGDGDDAYDTTNAIKLAKEHAIGSAWEIGHLTQGPYALDSWRIFCRDKLLGRAEDWKGKGRHPEFQPEWMRVLPRDKELRACLRWMWMREGWEWDPVTGEREPLREEMRRAVDEGRVAYDDSGGLVILDEKIGEEDTVQ
ncbi:hypothetical protein B0T20DRAFT_229671 [Sordaria brevicollis]|uniref:HhH-GPD domain-containing protein n=1 Tax=Sordaria brevicollis TaxID=83679 RepID=A0AAE0UB99_SORBR|nr:hypothetical protein B0T20DRAFT_229671 [Sordaria brevicollis]